jgi:hypothetical protein
MLHLDCLHVRCNASWFLQGLKLCNEVWRTASATSTGRLHLGVVTAPNLHTQLRAGGEFVFREEVQVSQGHQFLLYKACNGAIVFHPDP